VKESLQTPDNLENIGNGKLSYGPCIRFNQYIT